MKYKFEVNRMVEHGAGGLEICPFKYLPTDNDYISLHGSKVCVGSAACHKCENNIAIEITPNDMNSYIICKEFNNLYLNKKLKRIVK